ncbi:hypothetical protein LJC33_06370 [Eubacteriales bacterium OttesenSCG-928-N13]|nr:hypothetical protein [Eubacteriales bacterium OttesenSCG-928-N13]
MVAYGGIYNASTQLVFFTQVDQLVQVRFNSTLPSQNVSYPGSNSLTVDVAGDYEINYNLLLNANELVNVSFAVRNNGTIIPQTRGAQSIAFDVELSLSADGRLSGSTIASLAAGDTLDMVLSVINSLPANLDTALNGNINTCLTVKKLDALS